MPPPTLWHRFRDAPVALQTLAWLIAGAAVLLVVVALTGSPRKKTGATGAASATTTTTVAASTTSVAPTSSSAPASTAAPTTALVPTTTTVTVPATTAPATTTTSPMFCGAAANPYGYNLCGRGTLIVHPAADICSYFNCAANWADGRGYMELCQDGTYTMFGGRAGSCASHGGDKEPVYSGP